MKKAGRAKGAWVGRQGEQLASEYLKKQGVRLLARNYNVHGGEIDLIGYRRGGLLFFEVKTRTGDRWGTPAEAIGEQKLRCIERAAHAFLRQFASSGSIPVQYAGLVWLKRRIRYCRIDGIEVYLHTDGTLQRINRIEDMGYEIRQHARTE